MLRRSGLARRTPLKSTAWKRTWRPTGPSKSTRDTVDARDHGLCFLGCGNRGTQQHHRLPRRAGGTRNPLINLPSNLLLLCADHHRDIESNRRWAHDSGLLLHAGEVPADVPVLTEVGSVYLTNDGTVTTEPPEEGSS